MCYAAVMRLFALLLLPALAAAACVGDDNGNGPGDSGAPDTASPPLDAAPEAEASAPADAALQCEAGTADCDPNTPGCETDVLTSDTNCGSCGHDCGGTNSCVAGVCQPMAIATNVSSPISLSVSGTSVFWMVDTEVQRCPVTGCTTQYPGDVGDGVHVAKYSTSGASYITADNTNVYFVGWTSDNGTNGIYYCALAGCGLYPPSGLATSDDYALEVAGNTKNLYWLNGSDGFLMRVRKSDGNAKNLGIPYLTSLFDVAADDGHVLITDSSAAVNGGGLYVCGDPQNDCTTFVKLLDDARNVTTNGTLAFVSQSTNAIVSCDLTNGCSGSGTPVTPSEAGLVAITADASAVYWAIKGSGSNGTIRACALPDCPGGPRTLASNQSNPRSIVNDQDFVYWANGGTTANTGSIMRVRK